MGMGSRERSMTELIKLTTVDDFMELGKPEIHQIYAYKLEAGLYEGGPDERYDANNIEVHVDLQHKMIEDECLLLLRFAFEFKCYRWSGRVDYVIEYKLDQLLDIAHDVIAEFATRSAVMCVHPYVRSAVADLTSKLPIPAVQLPLIRPGELNFTSPTKE